VDGTFSILNKKNFDENFKDSANFINEKL